MFVPERDHLRKQIGGAALIASPILGFVGAAMAPRLDSDELKWLENIADAAGRASVSTIMNALSIVAAVFAVFALVHMLREREATYGQVGGALAIVGLVLTTMLVGMEAIAGELATSAIPPAAAAELLNDAATNPVVLVGLAGSALSSIGMVVVAVGLFRARAVPALSAIGIGLFAVGVFVAYTAFLSALLIASFAVLSAAAVPVGWQVLKETDEAWEHTPTFRGFHAQTI